MLFLLDFAFSTKPLVKGVGRPSLSNHRNREVGFLAGLRTMLFGARDPESDLSIEMLEELHMVTGCEQRSAIACPPDFVRCTPRDVPSVLLLKLQTKQRRRNQWTLKRQPF